MPAVSAFYSVTEDREVTAVQRVTYYTDGEHELSEAEFQSIQYSVDPQATLDRRFAPPPEPDPEAEPEAEVRSEPEAEVQPEPKKKDVGPSDPSK